jgi:hypothetical protein
MTIGGVESRQVAVDAGVNLLYSTLDHGLE